MQSETAFCKNTSIKPDYGSKVETRDLFGMHTPSKWLFYFAPRSVSPAVNTRSVKYAITNHMLETMVIERLFG